jgi:hypothetical protein
VTLVKKYHNVEIVQGNTIKNPCGSHNKYDIVQKCFPEYTNDRLWLKKHFLLFPRVPVNAWNKLIKRSFIVENNIYFREGIIHEDDHWMFFAAKKIRSMVFTTHYCYIHYITPDSIMRSGNNIKSLQSWLSIIQDMSENIDMEVQREESKYIYSVLCFNMYKIKTTVEYQQLLSAYRKIVRMCIKNARESFDIICWAGLLLFFLPCQVYNSYLCRILLKLLLGNWKNIFFFFWYTFKFQRWNNK